MKFRILVLALTLIPMIASANRVEFLGSTAIGNRPDYDVVPVHSCGFGDETVAALRIAVRRDAIRIDYLEVEYGNGQSDQLHIREYFQRGTSSQWLDLPGAGRCVRNVKIYAQSRPDFRGHQSLVEIWGLTRHIPRNW